MPPHDRWVQINFNGHKKRFAFPASEPASVVLGTMQEIFEDETYVTLIPDCDINPGDVVVDGGGYLGMFSWYALMKGASKVFTFEPNPRMYPYCRRNLAKTPAILSQFGLWSELRMSPKRLRLRVNWGNQCSARVVDRGDKFDCWINANRLDGMQLGRVNFLKLDVEGSEVEALEGARETIQTWKPTLAVALYHKPGDVERICETVKSFGGWYAESGPPEITGGKYSVGIWNRQT